MILLLLLLAFAGAYLDPSLCEQRTALKFVPSMSATSLGDWRKLQAGSAYASDATLTMNTSILRLTATPTSQSPLSAFEYTLPLHSGASSVGSAWLYDLNYTFAQNVNNQSCIGALGAWHAVGFDWGVPGSTPDLTAIQFASGGADARGMTRVSSATCRIQDIDVVCSLSSGLNSSGCSSFVWPARTVSDLAGELRIVRYQYIFDGRTLYPASVQTDFGDVRDSLFERAAVTAPAAWRAPTRLVYLTTASVFLMFQFKLARIELACPIASTTRQPSTTTTSVETAGPAATTSTSTLSTVNVASTTQTSTVDGTTAQNTITSSNRTFTPTQTATTLSTTPTQPSLTTLTTTVRTYAIDPPTELGSKSATSEIVTISVGAVVGLMLGIGCVGVFYALRMTSCWARFYEKVSCDTCKHVAPLRCCCMPLKKASIAAAGDDRPLAPPVRQSNSIYGPIDPSVAREPIVYDVVPPQVMTNEYGPVPKAPPSQSNYEPVESPLN